MFVTVGQTSQPQFEVASVRQIIGAHRRSAEWSSDPGQFRFNGPMKSLLIRAYGIRDYQLSGPQWLWNDDYQVVAKLPQGANEEQIPPMLKSLLAERFGLKVHWENKEQRVYALTTGRKKPHLRPSKDDTAHKSGMSFTTSGHLVFKNTTLTEFSGTMSNLLDRPLVDRTGIPGRYDITLDISMQDLAGMKRLVPFADANPKSQALGPATEEPASLSTAIQELGLELKSERAPVKRLFVDDIRNVPSGN